MLVSHVSIRLSLGSTMYGVLSGIWFLRMRVTISLAVDLSVAVGLVLGTARTI